MSDPAELPAPPLRRSLRTRLLWRVLLPLAVTWSIGNAVALGVSWALAIGAFDDAMLDDAYAIAASITERDGQLVLNLSPREVKSVLYDHEEEQYFAIHDGAGRLIAGDPGLRAALGSRAEASRRYFDGRLNGIAVRVAVLRVDAPRPFTVLVGQTTKSRRSVLNDILRRSVLPQVVLLLGLGAYLWRQITRELAPLNRLQHELNRRGSSVLEPVLFGTASSDIGRLRDAVNALLARIARSLQAQREFAGNVAHDLRTPLAGIRALAEYGLTHDDPATSRRQLERILQSEARATRQVEQLLAMALADEAQGNLHLEPVRVDELVRRTVLDFVARADAAGVDLGAEGIDSPVWALASPVLLEGVLTNLIDNALRHGSGAEAPTLTVSIADEGGDVRISVVDNGAGLDADEREGLRLRWVTGTTRDAGEAGGSGLGLAIASRYAALMQASLGLRENLGGPGLRAELRLLRADAPAGGATPIDRPA